MNYLIKTFFCLIILSAIIIAQKKNYNENRLIITPDGKYLSRVNGSITPIDFVQEKIVNKKLETDAPIGTPFSWDGTLSFSSSGSNTVSAIAVSGSDVFIGGSFTEAMGDINSNYIVRYNQKTNTWHPLGTGLNGNVRAIAVSGNNVYVGGDFTNAGGDTSADFISRWDGTNWNALGNGLTGGVNAIAVSGDSVYVGGDFINAGGIIGADYIAKWNGSGWNSIGQLDGSVYALSVYGSSIFVGGAFSSLSAAAADYFSYYNGTNWLSLGTPINDFVYAIAVSGSSLYIGGNFTNAGGNPNADAIAYFNLSALSGWQALGTGIINDDALPNGLVTSIAVSGADVYVGGPFYSGLNSDYNNIAYWNGTVWNDLNSSLFGGCSALALSGTDLFSGGLFGLNRWFGAYAEGLFSGLQNSAASGSGLVQFNTPNDSTRISLNLIEGSKGNGVFNVFCYENKPVVNAILPVSNHRWIIQNTGFIPTSNLVDIIRIKFSDFIDSSGIINPYSVQIYHRPTPGRGQFTALYTEYDLASNELWAYINSYGEFAIGIPNTVDGTIGGSEYGSHIQGENLLTSDGKTWYLNKDEYYFYFAISNYTDSSDVVNFYLDNSAISPVNFPGTGAQTGTGKDGLTTNLPFGAEFYAYVKPGYDEYKQTDQFSGWQDSVANSFIKSYNDPGNIFEFAIPLSSIPVSTNLPNNPLSSYNWLGYLSNGTGISSKVPLRTNPSGISTDLVWYFNTGQFSNNCYTHIGPSLNNFGAIDCYEFTFYPQVPSTFINRTSGEWNIEDDLWVYGGTLTFQNSGAVNVGGILTAGGTTNFSYNTSDAPLNVKYFLWQWVLGGTLSMDSGHILTFVPAPFNGSGNFQGRDVFQNVVINNPNKVYLGLDIKINESLTLNANISTITYDTFYVRMNQGAVVTRPGLGFVEGYLERWAQNGVVDFPVGTVNEYSPVSFNFNNVTNPNKVTVAAIDTMHPNVVIPAQSLKRYWKVTKDSTLAFTNTSINFQYLSADFNTAFFELSDEATMVVGKRDTSWSFPTILSRSPGGSNDGGSITVSGVTSFSDFTIGKNEAALPVELTSFTAASHGSKVLLKWTTATEVNNYGFDIERKVGSQQSSPGNWEKIGFKEGNGNSNSMKEYSFTDNKLLGGHKFYYRLKQIDNDGQFEFSDVVEVEIIPDKFELFQNYPNPFNPGTKIIWQSPVGNHQTLKVYDILGNEVATLVDEYREAGKYEIEFDASSLSSGVYLFRLQAGSFNQIKKMTLIK